MKMRRQQSFSSLTGRESLIRIVGKRRHFLPNLPRILLSSTPQSCAVEDADKDQKQKTTSIREPKSDNIESIINNEDNNNNVMVTCPVCEADVPGGQQTINSHLDDCLNRKKKRKKFTQSTLLQLNFCSKSKIQILPQQSPLPERNAFSENSNWGSFASTSYEEVTFGVAEGTGGKDCLSTSNVGASNWGLCEIAECPERGDHNVLMSLSTESSEILPEYEASILADSISGITLESFIVGRKFSDCKELDCGMKISLQREPSNLKDPNAIKVVSADSEHCMVFGYIPRELALHLSPLIDKYCMECQGWVTSVPKHNLDAVPVKIICQRINLYDTQENDNLEDFRIAWENVLCALNSLKHCPPKAMKYQQNFCLFLEEVLRNYSYLFTDEEKLFLESFKTLSDDCQRLFVRLYTRKGPWFRLCNISYPEVLDHQLAVNRLCELGFMCSTEHAKEMHDDEFKRILHMLTVAELRDILCTLKKKGHPGTRKQDLIASLLSSSELGLCPLLSDLVLSSIGTCIKISQKAEYLIWRSERLFFLNGEQDLSAFLLVDMGIVTYPSYKCIIADQIFSCRDDLLAYEEAVEVAQIMDQSLEVNNIPLVLECIMIADSCMPSSADKSHQLSTSEPVGTFLYCFSASWVYSYVVLLGVSFHERERRYRDAVKLLKSMLLHYTCDGRRGYWTLRLSIDLEHMGCIDESLSVAEEGLKDPWVRAGSRMALQRRVLRLGKPPRRWKTPTFSTSVKRKIKEVCIQGRPLNCNTGEKSRFYGEDGEQCGVEQLALQYYADEGGGWQGAHTESGIWLTLFGLLMWDVLFAEVPNVFRTKFQTAPLDLGTDSFYDTRKSLIESHLRKIHDGMAEEILITSWELYAGTVCRGVNWEKHSISQLRAAVACIGGPCLALLCRQLAQDYRSWSSGMPDLLLWRFFGEYKGEAKLVEVKGPRDQLSEQQRAWLLLLMDCGFSVEVCKVSPEPKLA